MVRRGRGSPAQPWRRASTYIPVVYDATGAGATAYNGTFTYSDTATYGAAVVVAAGFAGSIGTVTYGGVNMISLGSAAIGYTEVEFWGLLRGGTGTAQTISIPYSAASPAGGLPVSIVSDCVSYRNVGAFGTAITNSASSGTALTSGTIPYIPGQLVVQAFSNYDDTGISSYNKTQRYFGEAGAGGVAYEQDLLLGDGGANPGQFTATAAASTYWASVAIPLLPLHVSRPVV